MESLYQAPKKWISCFSDKFHQREREEYYTLPLFGWAIDDVYRYRVFILKLINCPQILLQNMIHEPQIIQ